MSKINALRFVNINYNNNMSKISDECLHLNGENTLLSMDNGVGKTVMVQLITALFVQASLPSLWLSGLWMVAVVLC